ncbi:hypothetical protein GCM10022289_05320 [Pedobacter jeongneungensis]|uniref:UDP-N-acetylglucosamine kinase n=1 Tax=Pedobacter jeongneungensis TaxID=947309 RepID=A0ABP8B4E3_9SPHI
MSEIFIIAGPPGIGKSTMGSQYIPAGLDLLNEDDMRLKYKEKGFVDYNEYSIHRVAELIKGKLIRNEDFALELNLGFQHQYDYVLSAKRFNAENKLNLILFYCDTLNLCLDRAKKRHENGLHLVKPDIITQMYNNTITLLKSNFASVDTIIFIDASIKNDFVFLAKYDREDNNLSTFEASGEWFKVHIEPFINEQIKILYPNKSNLLPWQPEEDSNESL